MKTLISFLVTLFAVAFMSSPIAAKTGISHTAITLCSMAAVFAFGAIDYHFSIGLPGVSLFGLNKQIWINQIMENFYEGGGHLLRSKDMTEFVEFNTINLAAAGVSPEVLINNTTYPIAVEEREDTPLAIPLASFDTVNTVVRDAESVELSYNKMESVISGHRNALQEKTAEYGTHGWAPQTDDSFTPVFGTTGAESAYEASRKAITLKDIAKAQLKLDLLKVPKKGRVLVLNPVHQADLMLADTALFKAFTNLKAGEVLPLFGFDIYVSNMTAKYNKNTGAKVAFGAAAASSTDSASSLFYYEQEVMKADGEIGMFDRLRDPEVRGDIVGFNKRFIALPIRNKYQGSIISAAS